MHWPRPPPTLFPELGLSLLHGRKNKVADGRSGQAVQARADAAYCDGEQVLRARVVAAVHDRADGEGERDLELGALRGGASLGAHFN
jgi:hypothetical protein